MSTIALTDEVSKALEEGVPLLLSVSGGADSIGMVVAVMEHLRETGCRSRVVMFHSDLGRIEWADSKRACVEAAERYNLPLVTVGEGQDRMLNRWKRRWTLSKERYQRLDIVNLIQPWSTPKLRFCTSEMKSVPAHREARRLFNGGRYINVTGVRADESTKRSLMPVSQTKADGLVIDWRPLMYRSKPEVFDLIISAGLTVHEGYTRYGSSRISCLVCIMSSIADLVASASNPAHAGVIREVIALEIESAYSFQAGRWLLDALSHLLTPEQQVLVKAAKEKALKRKQLEALIPADIRLERGRPIRVPTEEEAVLLAYVRREVSALYGLQSRYLDPTSVRGRYQELLLEAQRRSPMAPVIKLADLNRQLSLDIPRLVA